MTILLSRCYDFRFATLFHNGVLHYMLNLNLYSWHCKYLCYPKLIQMLHAQCARNPFDVVADTCVLVGVTETTFWHSPGHNADQFAAK